MARRMFSDEITTADAFLDMPGGSQLLYFHLGMEADDDGFISSPKMVMRAIGSTDDELKVLFAKKFLLPFESGVCVVKHWRINNQIRKDRYEETKYTKEKSQLYIRENGSYTFNPEGAIKVPHGHFLPLGNQMATIGQPSIGKESLDKIRKEASEEAEKMSYKDYMNQKGYLPCEVEDKDGNVISWWQDEKGVSLSLGAEKKFKNEYENQGRHLQEKKEWDFKTPQNVKDIFDLFDNPASITWLNNSTQKKAATELLKYSTYGEIKILVKKAKEIITEQFAPKISSPYDLLTKMEKLKAYKSEESNYVSHGSMASEINL